MPQGIRNHRKKLDRVESARLAVMVEMVGDKPVSKAIGVSRQALLRGIAGFQLNEPSRTKLVAYLAKPGRASKN